MRLSVYCDKYHCVYKIRKRKLTKLHSTLITRIVIHPCQIAHEDDQATWSDMNKEQVREVLNSELTKFEFAEALGLKATSSFVESMFNMIDVDNSGALSFREFVDLMIIFYKGKMILHYLCCVFYCK